MQCKSKTVSGEKCKRVINSKKDSFCWQHTKKIPNLLKLLVTKDSEKKIRDKECLRGESGNIIGLSHYTNLQSLKGILEDGKLRVGETCPRRQIPECVNAVYLSALFPENWNAILNPGMIYLIFSNLPLEREDYQLNTEIIYGKSLKGFTFKPDEIKKFGEKERGKFSRTEGEPPLNNEVVFFTDLPLNEGLEEIWVTIPDDRFFDNLVRRKIMTKSEAEAEKIVWKLVDEGKIDPPEGSFAREVLNMIRNNDKFGEYLPLLHFKSQIPEEIYLEGCLIKKGTGPISRDDFKDTSDDFDDDLYAI